jgi:hypothetical protein
VGDSDLVGTFGVLDQFLLSVAWLLDVIVP